MEVQRGAKSDKCDEPIPKSVKRPFDVAFLMLPDEKLKQKQKVHKTTTTFDHQESCFNNNDEDEEINIDEDSPCELKKFFTQKQQIFDDPNLIRNKNILHHHHLYSNSKVEQQKSAFTKVNLTSKESRSSPSLSISPDITYQNSLSPSPPINRNYQNIFPQNQIFKSVYQTANFMPENFQPPMEMIQPPFPKLRPSSIYRPELTYNYPNQEFLKLTTTTADIRNPAAAILTSLLPPSLAALSLPGQNVCAKCNITFRMTSDLVYHMRSHHKNESSDLHKRRREEKLKCPVCAESFRERHHLTRHMTAHQDKEEDDRETRKD